MNRIFFEGSMAWGGKEKEKINGCWAATAGKQNSAKSFKSQIESDPLSCSYCYKLLTQEAQLSQTLRRFTKAVRSLVSKLTNLFAINVILSVQMTVTPILIT